MSNAARTWFFLGTLMIIIVVMGQTTGGREGLLWGVGIALSINSLIYFYTDLRLNHLFHGQRLEGEDPWQALATLKGLCKKARIPIPQLIVLEQSAPQSMVMGRHPKSARVIVTRGLLEEFNTTELKAVLAFHVAAIKRQDILAFTVASAFLDTLLTICRIFDGIFRILVGANKNRHSTQSHLFSVLCSPLAGFLLRLNVGQTNYLASDKMAAELCDDPQGLAKVLWKLSSYSLTRPLSIPASTAHLWMVNPLTNHGWARYFHVQPKVELRIRNLVGYYPI